VKSPEGCEERGAPPPSRKAVQFAEQLSLLHDNNAHLSFGALA